MKVLGNVASKIRSVTEVFFGLIDVINILQIFHELEKYTRARMIKYSQNNLIYAQKTHSASLYATYMRNTNEHKGTQRNPKDTQMNPKDAQRTTK